MSCGSLTCPRLSAKRQIVGSGFAAFSRSAAPKTASRSQFDISLGIELPRHGYRAEFFIGSSRDLAIIEAAQQRAPFDTALIDGDHSYEGARADGIAYGSLARIVAFHDIAGENVTK